MPEPKAMVVDASRFARSFARFQHDADQVDVIEIHRHGQLVGGYLSARELEHYKRLKRREREVFVVGELPDDLIADLEAAKYEIGPG